ncbi:MAG TPA: ATP-binding protein [Bryobacteraceae bacterium]|nr:ATP-binding protein [Bryobacteraceae bacterium]
MINARILNVDDHDAGRYARTRFLSRAGFTVDEARTGEEALIAIKARAPDLVLLDINLPDIDGFEVCRRIKSDPETARIAVIFLSAARLADLDVVAGLDHGGDNYLREPVDPAVLVATVRALLRERDVQEALVRSNEQLRRFAFVVSHELQEPLRMVKSYTQLLAQRYKSDLAPEAAEFMDTAISGVNRMEKFIHDMLAYSQAAEADMDVKSFSCQTALDWALMELEPAIRESSAVVTSDSLPVVMGDPMRLSQVFKNLIGNAIKYKSDQTPAIHVSAVVDGSTEHVICINDNGIGIDAKYFDNIFVLFKRLHGRDRSGSGVGLAICKEIVEHHGGRIWVESQIGSGSRFCFTLPKVSIERAASTT